jgi:phosphomevalonate kinase
MRVEASAPGKLILIGEYSVLFGAPAAVMAVDRRARVTLQSNPEPHWLLTAPGLTDHEAGFEVDSNGAVAWAEPDRAALHFTLVDRLLAELSAAGMVDLAATPPARATLDTRSFFARRGDDRRKLGLGSSAALTVAMVTGLVALEGQGPTLPPSREWLQALVSLHRVLQGGRGSGADVAASLLGGIVRFRLDDSGSVAEAGHWSVPDNLKVRCVWTGRAASTGSFLERLDARRAVDAGGIDRVLDDLGQVSERGVAALADIDGSQFLGAVDAFGPALERLGRMIDMPILSEDHRLLMEIAQRNGVSYKPSGAGGGDFGLAFALVSTTIDGFCQEVGERGFDVLDIEVDPTGSTVTID